MGKWYDDYKKLDLLGGKISFILENDEDTEEIASDTYLKAWNTIPPKRPNPFKSYLGMIARSLALDRYEMQTAQKRGGETALVLDELAECIPDSAGNTETTVLLRDVLNRFIRSLPSKMQIIFMRRYWYAEPICKIAEDLHMTENAVCAVLCRARRKLKLPLEKEGFALCRRKIFSVNSVQSTLRS